jgi:hypothetical protein
VQGAVLRFLYLHKQMVNLILIKKRKEMDNLLMQLQHLLKIQLKMEKALN